MKAATLALVIAVGVIALAGWDVARLQDGLESPAVAFVEQVNSNTSFQAPTPISAYDQFDVAVNDDVSVRVYAREHPNAAGNIFMVHGAGGGAWAWEEMFDRLPHSYNLYALSWRGHFDSTPVGDADSSEQRHVLFGHRTLYLRTHYLLV